MKVLIITDSLGLPRPVPEIVLYEETWCHKLSEISIVHQCSLGGGTIDQLSSQLNYLKMFSPDFVIVQSGIVDCTPRALTKTENYLVNKFWLSRKLMNYFSKLIIRSLRKRGKTYTTPKVFSANVNRFLKEFGSKLYWVGIIPAVEKYENKITGVEKNINTYNTILQEKLKMNYISTAEFSESFLMSDFHHLNKAGHHKLFLDISGRLKLSN